MRSFYSNRIKTSQKTLLSHLLRCACDGAALSAVPSSVTPSSSGNSSAGSNGSGRVSGDAASKCAQGKNIVLPYSGEKGTVTLNNSANLSCGRFLLVVGSAILGACLTAWPTNAPITKFDGLTTPIIGSVMRAIFTIVKLLPVIALAHLLSACAPEVGSTEWCKSIKEKAKGDLTMNEAKDYAKHCVFK